MDSSSNVFFISLDGECENLNDRPLFGQKPVHSRSHLMDQRLSHHGSPRSLEEEGRRLSSSMKTAEENRRSMLAQKAEQRAIRDQKRMETLKNTRKRQERIQREHLSRMKERDYVVAYRRQLLLHVPRSKLMEAELKTDHLNLMASLIQNTWCHRHLRPIVKRFLDTGIIDTTVYTVMQEGMMKNEIICIANEMIIRMVKCDPIADSVTVQNSLKNGRIFLTGLMLSLFGEEVMPDPSASEMRLLESAGRLLTSLRSFMSKLGRKSLLSFAEDWVEFTESFRTWQSVSKPVLVQQLQADYLMLQETLESLGVEARREWIPHVQRHQKRLRLALQRVAGQEAINSLEKELQSKLVLDVQEEPDVISFEEPVADEATVSAVKERVPMALENIHIAHELSVDAKFSYRKLMEVKTGNTYKDEIPIMIPDEISQSDLVSFLVLVRDQLIDMLKGKGELVNQLNDKIDREFIIIQSSSNSLPIREMFHFITEVMSQICAPLRDELISNLHHGIGKSTNADVCRDISRILMLMHEDLANYGLTMVKPHLATIIIPYERQWYTDNIDTSNLSLTFNMVKGIYEVNREKYQSMMPLAITHNVIAESFIKVTMNQAKPTELMILDQKRLTSMKVFFEKVIYFSAIVLSQKGFGHKTNDDEEMALKSCFFTNADIPLESCISDLVPMVNISRVYSGTDPLVGLIRRRVESILKGMLTDEDGLIKPTPILARHGISAIIADEFNDAALELFRAYKLHRDVLSPLYHNLITTTSNSH